MSDALCCIFSYSVPMYLSVYVAWLDPSSSQRVSGHCLAEHLVDCMKNRLRHNQDSIDLIIGGIEASLWLGEQFGADLGRVFPYLNIMTLSSNK
jgi:hypothetical protein